MDDQSKGLSVKEAQAVVDRFLADYNGNIPLRNLVRANQEDIYGPQASREKIGIRIDGAYHPGSGLITIVASNMGDEGAIVRTLRHELLGHFGLNTFDPEEKERSFLAFLKRVTNQR